MNRGFLYRLLALALVIAVPSLATVAVAHAHPHAKAPHESHCRICMAAHGGTSGLASSPTSFRFIPVVAGVAVQACTEVVVSAQRHPSQDRAPPVA